MMKIKILGTILSLGAMVACTTSEKVEEIDTSLDKKGSVGNSHLGLNDDGVAILQTETTASDELRSQIWLNNDLETAVNHEYYMLKWCRKDLADPRLGGSGEISQLPEIDDMKTPGQVKEDFGIEGDALKIVKRESYLKRLKSERKLEKTLRQMIKTVKKSRENCEMRMAGARVKAGLPAARFEGNVSISPEGKVEKVIYAQEKSLDDAFRIIRMKQQ
ncbi:MAG: hypothetical protein AB8G05_08220 [Oligoflexales bacterium]